MPEVKVYSTKQCPYCRMVKAFLEKHGIEYENIDVGEDEEAARELFRVSKQLGVPVTVVGEDVVVGFDAPRLNALFGTEKKEELYDVVILGAGPAGLTAAVYTTRKLLSTLIISENIGGQAMESWAVENYMGYRVVSGEDLMAKFEEQARGLNISLELDRATGVRREDDSFVVTTYGDRTVRAKSVIVATGRSSRRLGVEGEERFWGRGVSVCSTCDGPLFRGKDVAVVGGGNSAVTTTLEMAKIARTVHLIVRSTLKADAVYLDLLKTQENVTVHQPYVVSGLVGETVLTGMRIRQKETGAEEEIAVDGVFAEIGHEPNIGAVRDLVRTNAGNEIVVDENCHTSVPGIFAAGDVTSIHGKQIIIAAGEGAKAALEAHAYLLSR
ncbi:MAG: FAD-dependent oxidoreductase [Methanofollis sp.]|uniref:FAD-dependent oxidoreductase n=1 Tax=Methanofollis sp. TaxID=2052835 RepID=UPI0026370013|nr:FAD-dependent oxidoreductase [Methanofollis sp.]MDD4255913.1 FAD-dependent oxidoreductase [Methanofollis sp.]